MRPTPRSRYAALTPVWCECRYAAPFRTPATAMVNPTSLPPSNAPSTCPPVIDATTNIVDGSSSKSSSAQISRCNSTHAWNSSRAEHFLTCMPPPRAPPLGLWGWGVACSFFPSLPLRSSPPASRYAWRLPTVSPFPRAGLPRNSDPCQPRAAPSPETAEQTLRLRFSMRFLDQLAKSAQDSPPRTTDPPSPLPPVPHLFFPKPAAAPRIPPAASRRLPPRCPSRIPPAKPS